MSTMNLWTKSEAARMFGVSRQALEQAIVKVNPEDRPVIATSFTSGGQVFDLYEPGVIREWWDKRLQLRLAERRQRGGAANVSLMIRCRPEEIAGIDAARRDGQSRAATARRLIALGLTYDNSDGSLET